jgi:hypothetical protein
VLLHRVIFAFGPLTSEEEETDRHHKTVTRHHKTVTLQTAGFVCVRDLMVMQGP